MDDASNGDIAATSSRPPADLRRRSIIVWLLGAILLILTAWLMRAAASVAVPVIAALFIALAVSPVDERVRRLMPRKLKWVGHAAAMTVVVLILAAFFIAVYLSAQQAASHLPNTMAELQAALPGGAAHEPTPSSAAVVAPRAGDVVSTPPASQPAAVGGSGHGLFGIGIDVEALFDRTASYLADHGVAYGRTVLATTASFIGGLALVFALVLLMLIEGRTWREKAVNALGERRAESVKKTLSVTAKSFRWYIAVRAMLGLVTATLYVAWLGVFGVGLLLVWGVLAFLLNFIPTLGSILAGGFPVIYAFATKDWATASIIAAGILAIEQVMGNFVDPRIQGKQLSVSPLVTFFALLLFGWMWGVMGALLAVPAAVFIVIACAHSEKFRPLGLLLSDSRDMEGLRRATSG